MFMSTMAGCLLADWPGWPDPPATRWLAGWLPWLFAPLADWSGWPGWPTPLVGCHCWLVGWSSGTSGWPWLTGFRWLAGCWLADLAGWLWLLAGLTLRWPADGLAGCPGWFAPLADQPGWPSLPTSLVGCHCWLVGRSSGTSGRLAFLADRPAGRLAAQLASLAGLSGCRK